VIETFFILLLLTGLTGWIGVRLVMATNSALANAVPHEPLTRWDSYLPLRGRWLGYVVATCTGTLSVACLLLATILAVGVLVLVGHWLEVPR